ncbi:hypothetical protein J3R30DRAFT_70719 [Lentinula aciculospora]|uniref:F-box domain-containing protein n=1 Tax=Lentinula aciculospora TaxID=153920 RepID=A0A9W9ATQ9_9AGAR|nr:hypothetical protein J3R30DRAFT_70719 [Lentinula aciculospora]
MYPISARPRPAYYVLPSLDSFPRELLYEIAVYLPAKDVPSFCLVCKEFNLLSLDILYKRILNVNSRCLDTLAYKLGAARAVKTLVLPAQINKELDRVCTWLGEDNAYVSKPEDPTVDLKAASILPFLYNLQDLSVPSFSNIYTQPLSQCHFPYLRNLSYAMPITHPIALFLSRNTTLVSLTFNCYLPLKHNLACQAIAIPQLRYLSSNPQVIKLFAKGAPLETVHIDWKFERAKMEVLDETLEILALQCTYNTEILVKVSEQLPRIVKLGLNSIDISDRLTVDNAFSRFEYLEHLNMDQHPPNAVRPPQLLTKPDYDRDEAMIILWTSDEYRSTLRECRLPNGILWSLRQPNLWLPSLSTVPQRKSILLDASKWCKRRCTRVDQTDDELIM